MRCVTDTRIGLRGASTHSRRRGSPTASIGRGVFVSATWGSRGACLWSRRTDRRKVRLRPDPALPSGRRSRSGDHVRWVRVPCPVSFWRSDSGPSRVPPCPSRLGRGGVGSDHRSSPRFRRADSGLGTGYRFGGVHRRERGYTPRAMRRRHPGPPRAGGDRRRTRVDPAVEFQRSRMARQALFLGRPVRIPFGRQRIHGDR